MQALEYIKGCGALCVGVTNTVGSAIARTTDCGVHINAGCEIGVASTKAYTSQIVVITMIALALSEDSLSKRAKRDEIIGSLAALPDKIRQVRPGSCPAAARPRNPCMLASTRRTCGPIDEHSMFWTRSSGACLMAQLPAALKNPKRPNAPNPKPHALPRPAGAAAGR